MSQIYEAMVLLDNDVVREGYDKAKSAVTDTLTKYGANIHACRRWDERRLAFPMKRKNRATYFLAYFEMPGDQLPGYRRELELSERVLRYLVLAVDEIPEGEVEGAQAEEAADFEVPAPPEDDAIEMPEDDEDEGDDYESGGRESGSRDSGSGDSESKESGEAEKKAPSAEGETANAGTTSEGDN